MRRVVLGLDDNGRSVPSADAPPPTVFLMDSLPDAEGRTGLPSKTDRAPLESDLAGGAWAIAEMWSTETGTLASGQTDPTVGAEWMAHPPAGGSMWRHAVWAPNFSAPMHRTNTLDYDTVLSGEVYLIHEAGETLLQTGDVVVIPGLLHGWRTGDKGCTLGCVMIGLPEAH